MTERYGGAPVGGAATSAVPADVENFFDKYSQGIRVVVEGAQADTGRTPKEVVWTRNKARLYRYEPSIEKKHPVPILIIYALARVLNGSRVYARYVSQANYTSERKHFVFGT